MSCCAAGCLIAGVPLGIYAILLIIDSAAGAGGVLTWIGAILAWIISSGIGFYFRMQLKEKYNLVWEGDAMEFLCWCCCDCCSIIQEHKVIMNNVDFNTHEWVGQAGGIGPQVGQPMVVMQGQAMQTAAVPVVAPDNFDKNDAPASSAPPVYPGGPPPPAPPPARACCASPI